MPFIESSESLRAKTHTSNINILSLAGILTLVCVAVGMFMVNIFDTASGASFELSSHAESTSDSSSADTSATETSSTPQTQSSSASSELVVFVSGHVHEPGVYQLPADSRVGDAVTSAGGFLDDANTEYNNLARKLADGEQIHIPSIEDSLSTPTEQQGGATTSGAAASSSGPININSATEAELETLPGVGPATAAKIVADREANGPFNSVEEIMRISGIGEKKYASLEGLICV